MDSAVKSVYVTGVAGFLGSTVAQDLLGRGWRVVGCDNFSVGREENVPPGVDFSELDCRYLKAGDLNGVDAVIHCAAIARSAWPDPDQLWWSNVRGTVGVVSAAEAAGLSKVVHASSSVVHLPGSSAYAETKALSERVALGYGATCLRFGNIYGAGQNELGHEPNVIASMRKTLKEKGYVRVDGDGSQTRDFVHVSDAANAMFSALVEPTRGIWFDICTGVQTSIRQIAESFGAPIEWGPTRNDPPAIIQDPKPAEVALLWGATVDIEEGLAEVTKL